MIALTVIFVSLVTAFVMTPLVRRLGLQFGFVDHPGERKLHRQPIVRVGGIAIALGSVVAIATAWYLSSPLITFDEWFNIVLIGLGGLSFFVIGLADDMLNLHPILRLFLQGAVTVISWHSGLRIEFLPFPMLGAIPLGVLSLPITFFWLAGVANAINWMDGMDGLAAGISTITALIFAIVCLQVNHLGIALIALALAGASLGFLRYNTNPAKIFMGDGGSYFIGFVLAGIGITGLMQEPDFTQLSLPYLILLVPILDMIFVILSRLLDGKSPFFPDQRHLHHRLLQSCVSRVTTVWAIYGLTIWSGLGALFLLNQPLGWLSVFVTTAILSSTNPYLGQQLLHLLSKEFLLRRLIFQPAASSPPNILND